MARYYKGLVSQLPTILFQATDAVNNVVWLVFLLVVFLGLLFNEPIGKQLSQDWGGIHPGWSLAPIVGLCCWGLLKANYKYITSVEEGLDGANTELAALKSQMPRVEISGKPYIDERAIVDSGGHEVGRAYFAHIKFANNPTKRAREADANRVFATIEVYSELKVTQFEFYGRWGTTEQPSSSPGIVPRERLPVNLEANGLPHELDLAIKYKPDKVCYAFNNDSYAAPDWKIPEYSMNADKFFLKVQLQGEMPDIPPYWLRLYNHGTDAGMHVEIVTEPTFRKAESWPPIAS